MADSLVDRSIRFVVALSLISSPLAYAKGPEPESHPPTRGFAWGRGDLPFIPSNPKAGQAFTGYSPNQSHVWFTGDLGANGLPEVERFNKASGHWERGPLLPDGHVDWRTAETSKVPTAPAGAPPQKLAPLPPERSLVVFEDGPKNWERAAHWNNESEERFKREKAEFTKNPAKAATTLPAVIDGTPDGKPGRGARGFNERAWSEQNRVLGSFSTQAIAWGISLGFIALFKISTDYSNNPLVMQKYLDSLQGPVGWLSFIGFSIAYGLVYAKMVSNAPYGGMMKQLPGFMAALFAGTAVQFGISTLGNDPLMSSCIGFTNYNRTGNFLGDMDACQAAFTSAHVRQLSLKAMKEFVPAMLATTIAGVSYFALYPTAARFFMNSRLGGALIEAGSQAGVNGALLRLGLPVAITGALIYLTQGQQQAILSGIKTWWATTGRWQDGPYAANVGQAEDDLYSTWEAMKKANFANPAPVLQAKKVCYDAKRTAAPQYDCDKPTLDFEGVISAYADQLNGWRAGMLEPTQASMGEWNQKVAVYRSNLNAAHDWYKLAIEKILFTKQHPEAPETDERVFNARNMKASFDAPLGWFRSSQDGVFKNVQTVSFPAFFMASLACGPETEGQGELGVLDTLRSYAKRVTGYYSPSQVIEDSKGWKTKFHPPRITDALMDSHETVCDNRSLEFGSDKFWKWVPTNHWTPLDLLGLKTNIPTPVDKFLVRSHGKNYYGLPAYIVDNVRPSVISADGENFFERWWAQTVGRDDLKFDAEIERQFQKMMFKTFRPIMNSPDYFWCDDHPKTRRTALEKYLFELASGKGQACGAQRTHRLARGVVNGLLDEARLYLALSIDLFATSGEAFRSASDINDMRLSEKTRRVQFENLVRSPAIELMSALEKYGEANFMLKDRAQMIEAAKVVEDALNKYTETVFPAKEKLGPPRTDAVKRQREVMDKLVDRVVNVANSLDTYLKMSTNGRLTGAPVWKEIK